MMVERGDFPKCRSKFVKAEKFKEIALVEKRIPVPLKKDVICKFCGDTKEHALCRTFGNGFMTYFDYTDSKKLECKVCEENFSKFPKTYFFGFRYFNFYSQM